MQDYEIKHIERIRELAPECMVLLKSDGIFPLPETGEIALYGSGARRTIKGGTGSGDVNVRCFTTVEEGLENAGFTITSKSWLDSYDSVIAKATAEHYSRLKARIAKDGLSAVLTAVGAVMPEPDYDFPLDGAGDTALYVLSRNSGEGSDRRAVKGDFMLSDTEIRDIQRLAGQYRRFMLVLNVGGPMDLSPVADSVANILLLSQLGTVTGDAFADILLGKTYPSGKLTTSWSRYEDYPHIGDFGNMDDTRYKEGIYVGYRWFDTAGVKPLFPFGFGLSYTSFDVAFDCMNAEKSRITVTAKVKNTCSHLGKETLQLYVSLPEGKLDQPVKTLAAFQKTKELMPGESETLALCFDLIELASFHTETSSAILEQGDYVLLLGTSSADCIPCGVVRLMESTMVQQLHSAGGSPDFMDWRPEKRERRIPQNLPVVTVNADDISALASCQPVIDEDAANLVKTMTDEELISFCVGNYKDSGSQSFIGNAAFKVAGAAGETCSRWENRGIPSLVMADGPAGLRLAKTYGEDENGVWSIEEENIQKLKSLLPDCILEKLGVDANEDRKGAIKHQYCTAIPIGTALAQSWNPEVQFTVGDIVGKEMELFGIHLWLAPALNIHRDPLCGRNFEYFSEDPLVSGKTAAAITMGVQKHPGRGVTIKHFCCNNQETNRFHSNSIVSQRALRDIYLRGFRIVIQEADPATVMSSYNLLNGEHTSQRRDLMETVLRDEWGYGSVVMSDWVTGGVVVESNKYPGACAHASVMAGNDIMMPGGPIDAQNILASLADESAQYHITRESLEISAARVIALARRMSTEW